MSRLCCLAIADENETARRQLRDQVIDSGRQVVVDAASRSQLMSGCEQTHPDLVIADVGLAADSGTSTDACHGLNAPLIVVSLMICPTTLAMVVKLNAMACLRKPLRKEDLEAAIVLALHQSAVQESFRQQVESLRRDLAERKLIERAKGILMRHIRIDEQQAFTRMRNAARMNRQKLVDVARSILLTGGLLGDAESGADRTA